MQKNEYNTCVTYIQHTLSATDKNRPGVYKFRNKDYAGKIPVWLPKSDNIIALEDLPDNWDMYSPPDEHTQPTCYEIRLSADMSGIKGLQRQTIVLNSCVYELCEMLNDLKIILFGSIDPEGFFLCNYNGNMLSPLRCQKGSIMELFAKVTGERNSK